MRGFTVLGAPIGKERARVVNGHAHTPAKTKDYEQWVQLAARNAKVSVLQGPVKLSIVWAKQVPASWSKKHTAEALAKVYATGTPDMDNVVKAISDALNRIAYVDDSQIAVIQASRVYVEQPSSVRVEVTSLESWEAE